jgi:gas vesicle protein
MPTDPVYNPHLPSASVWSPSSSSMRSNAPPSDHLSMSDESSSSWSALSVGLLAGAVAGAALALMFTPSRGTEMRDSIRRYASDGAQRASSLIEQGRQALRSGWASASDSVASPSSSMSFNTGTTRSGSQPLTASVAEISGIDRRFEEPLGG